MSNQISFTCNSCSKVINAPEHLAGKSAQCPSCQSSIQIPEAQRTAQKVPTKSNRNRQPEGSSTKRNRRNEGQRNELPSTPKKTTRRKLNRSRQEPDAYDEQSTRGRERKSRNRRNSRDSAERPRRNNTNQRSNNQDEILGPGNETLALVFPIVNGVSFFAIFISLALDLPTFSLIFMVTLMLISGISGWKIYSRNGEPGWSLFVPFYGAVVFARIGGKPWWWLFLMMIPFAGPIFLIILIAEVCKKMNRGIGFTVGYILLPIIFQPMLAFGDASLEEPDY